MPRRNTHAQSRWSPSSDERHAIKLLNQEMQEQAFWRAAFVQRRCQHQDCPHPSRKFHAHHVVYKQHVKQYDESKIWDPRNSLRLCITPCHFTSQHQKKAPVAVTALRTENIEFMIELMGRDRTLNYLHTYYDASECDVTAIVDTTIAEAA